MSAAPKSTTPDPDPVLSDSGSAPAAAPLSFFLVLLLVFFFGLPSPPAQLSASERDLRAAALASTATSS